MLWFTRKEKIGKAVVLIGVVLLGILGYGFISEVLLRPLEYKYPPMLKFDDAQSVKWLVVLGGGHTSDPQLPANSQLSGASLARLVEGIRLHNMLPGSKLILSGGSGFDEVPNSEVLADVALAIGVDKRDLVLESASRDTKDEGKLIQKILGNDKFILVTSASHMPRSVALFERLGMKPIPASADYWVKNRQGLSPGMFFPSADGLMKAERVFYEYMGLAWAKLRGQI
jgi:uncharacterized SAM-binding protein YcdF (DUF218 family)